MSWLLFGITLDIIGTIALKLSYGFTKLFPTILMSLFYALSIVAFAFAIKKIDVGMAYALWSGLATAAVATIGIFYFNEPTSAVKLMSIALIIIGVVGLNLT